jgi:hypothetical protein
MYKYLRELETNNLVNYESRDMRDQMDGVVFHEEPVWQLEGTGIMIYKGSLRLLLDMDSLGDRESCNRIMSRWSKRRTLLLATIMFALSFVQLMLSSKIVWDLSTLSPAESNQANNVLSRPPQVRVLLGIFSTNDPSGRIVRQRHRENFERWNSHQRAPTRVCSWSEWQLEAGEMSSCALIYTFVIGAAGNDSDFNVPSVIDDDRRPMLADRSASSALSSEPDDLTLLNIRENVHEGKSQTWLKYASKIADQMGLEYVAKSDPQSWLNLAEYFAFANQRLRPPPYNAGTMAGGLRDKAFWKHIRDRNETERLRFEGDFDRNFLFHLYMSGG